MGGDEGTTGVGWTMSGIGVGLVGGFVVMIGFVAGTGAEDCSWVWGNGTAGAGGLGLLTDKS